MVMTVLLGLVLPVLAGGGIVALCWLLPPLRKWTWLAGASYGLALATGVFASFAFENGLPAFPPDQKAEWLGIVAAVAAVFALLMPLTGQPGQQRSWPLLELSAVVVGGLVAKLPLLAAMAEGIPLEEAAPKFSDMTWADQIGIGLGVALGMLLFDRVAANRPGFLMPLVLMIVFGGLAPLADAAGWITLTFLAATAAGVSFVAALAARFGGSPTIGRGGLVVAAILLAIFPIAGFRQTYGDFPWWCWVLVVGSPWTLLVFEIPVFGKLPPWAGNTLRLLAIAGMVGFAVLTATSAAGGADDGGAGGFGDYSYE